MRARKSGLILNIVSLAGLRMLQVAGLPYSASKFAQSAIGHFANLESLGRSRVYSRVIQHLQDFAPHKKWRNAGIRRIRFTG